MKKKRRILYASTEIAPFTSESPLAEMSRHLPRILRTQGHDIRVVMPKYSFIRDRNYNLREVIRLREIPVPLSGKLIWVAVKSGFIPDTRVQVYFLENEEYFARGGVINDPDSGKPYDDNDDRYIVFTRAVIVMLKILSWQPQIIHCSDFTGALLPFYLKHMYSEDSFYNNAKVVLSIVDYENIGEFSAASAFKAGIDPNAVKTGFDLELEGKLCFLKAGIMNADKVIINGDNSLNEFPQNFQNWLGSYISKTKNKFHHIQFGLDSQSWNPEKEEKISGCYSQKNLAGKTECKSKLLDKYSLKVDMNAPLVGCIWEGGDFKNLNPILDSIKQLGGGFIIADKSATEEQMDKLQKSAPDSIGTVKLLTGLSLKQLLAGCDIIVLASDKYKDLYHLKAMRFGAAPIVPTSGYFGDDVSEDKNEGTGFMYDLKDKNGLAEAFKRAVELFKDEKSWNALIKRIIKVDSNWNKFARAYSEVYEELG